MKIEIALVRENENKDKVKIKEIRMILK